MSQANSLATVTICFPKKSSKRAKTDLAGLGDEKGGIWAGRNGAIEGTQRAKFPRLNSSGGRKRSSSGWKAGVENETGKLG